MKRISTIYLLRCSCRPDPIWVGGDVLLYPSPTVKEAIVKVVTRCSSYYDRENYKRKIPNDRAWHLSEFKRH